MLLRMHRGSLSESMKTIIEIDSTIESLENAIRTSLIDFCHIDKTKIKVEPYCYDDRIKWDTHIVTIDGYGVYGFTDGPIND